jgi:hypothetical protein
VLSFSEIVYTLNTLRTSVGHCALIDTALGPTLINWIQRKKEIVRMRKEKRKRDRREQKKRRKEQTKHRPAPVKLGLTFVE